MKYKEKRFHIFNNENEEFEHFKYLWNKCETVNISNLFEDKK